MRSRWLAAVLSAAAAAIPEPQEPEARSNLALIVGIDEYDGKVPTLHGAENDARRAGELLRDRFGFAPADIKTLLGSEATHKAIVQTFHEHLIQKAGPATKVVIWYSGHGSRVPDKSKKDTSPRDDYEDSWDDTLLAYDSRKGDRKGSYDVTDDELQSLLAALHKKGVRDIVMVTDCCHSGGLMRGEPAGGVRHALLGTESLDRTAPEWSSFWPEDVPFLDDDRGRVATSVVHIAACESMQEAGEYDSGEGQWHGTLTWFLTNTLREVDAETSWQAVTAKVRARIAAGRTGTRPGQLVQCNGDESDRTIFGGQGKSVPSGFPVRRLDGKVRIEGGRIHGIVEESELRLVDFDRTDHGLVRVDRARAVFSEAVPIGDGKVPVGEALWAIPEKGLEGRAPLRVACGNGVDAKLLQGCDWVVATPGDAADYVLVVKGGRFELQTADGTFVREVSRERAVAHRELFFEHCFRSLWEGVARPGRFRVGLTVAEHHAAPDGIKRPTARVFPTGDRIALVGARDLPPEPGAGHFVLLTVTNHSKVPLHVAVLSVAEDRAINVIWGKNGDNELGPDANLTIPVEVGPNPTWRPKRPMIDRYIVIATRKYADFTAFESNPESDVMRGGGGLITEEMPTFLAGALTDERTRGSDAAKAPAWGIHWLDLELVRPDLFVKLTKKR